MRRFCVLFLTVALAFCVSYCGWDTENTSTVEQGFGSSQQGTQLTAIQLHGSVENQTMWGFRFAGATLGGVALTNVHLEKGELVADLNGVTKHGAGLKFAHLIAEVKNLTANPPTTSTVEYEISNVIDETTGHDPTSTGGTYLYSLSQNVDNTGWEAACPTDGEGLSVAIPVAGVWDNHGDRSSPGTLFTFSCTTGVIAKCYRWGYKPWLDQNGYGDVATVHWICTRAARADYCGNGTTHTRDGTWINIWDNLAPPGPIQEWGSTPLLMTFEAGWDTGGAVCLSHTRWATGGLLIAQGCPNRLIPPALPLIGGTVCDGMSAAVGQAANAHIFNESNVNLNLDILGP